MKWLIAIVMYFFTIAPVYPRDGVPPTPRTTARKKHAWQMRRNRAADQALAGACYLYVPNDKPEQYEDVLRALERGARPDIQDRYGFTPLMHEALWGHRRTVLLLLRYGASAHQVDSEGRTALMYACESPVPDEQIVAALLRHGASVRQRDKKGHNAIYYARINRNQRLISLLLRHLRQQHRQKTDRTRSPQKR